MSHCVYDITSCSECDKGPLCPTKTEADQKVGDELSEDFTACHTDDILGIQWPGACQDISSMGKDHLLCCELPTTDRETQCLVACDRKWGTTVESKVLI